MVHRFAAIALFTVIVLNTIAVRAWAYPYVLAQPYWDLDSLVFTSDAIVEGRFIQPGSGTLRITAVHAGRLKVGQTITIARPGDFLKPRGSGRDTRLGPTDHLLLLLCHDKSPGVFAIDPNRVWLIVRGRVCDFYPTYPFVRWAQAPLTPQPCEADLPGVALAWPILPNPWRLDQHKSIVDFRASVRQTHVKASRWRAHFDTPVDKTDVGWLLDLLKERRLAFSAPATDWDFGYDVIAREAAKRLVQTHDLPAMEQGILIDPMQSAMLHEFANPAGHDYLLRRMTDRTLPKAHRERMAQEVASFLNSETIAAATQFVRPHKAPEPRVPSDLIQIAKAAALLAEAGDEEVAEPLLGALTNFIEMNRTGRGVEMENQFAKVADVLLALYERHLTSDLINYRIERTTQAISPARYAQLNSKCGPILLLARPPPRRDRFSQVIVPIGKFEVPYELRWLGNNPATWKVTLVLQSETTGAAFILPSSISPTTSGEPGTEVFSLPPGLQPGAYRIFYRVIDGVSVISEGRGYETTIPLPIPPLPVPNWSAGPPKLPPLRSWPLFPRPVTTSMIAMLALSAALILRAIFRSRRQHRRLRKGLCPQCGYDLRFAANRCPECGRATTKEIERGILRRCIGRIACVACLIVFAASATAFVRSFWVADCMTRTAPNRADSFYADRGSFVVQLQAVEGAPGWTYDGSDPSAFPTSIAQCADPDGPHCLGIEYSSAARVIVVPFAWPGGMAGTIAAVLIWRLLRRRRMLGNRAIR
jgi:hypothetical protein